MASSDSEDELFESTDAAGDDTFPMQASALREGGYVVIKNRPCKIVDIATSKTGKHGHAKVRFVATDIFTSTKMETFSPSTHNMLVPHVERTEYTLVDVSSDGDLSLLTEVGTLKEDVTVDVDSEIGAALLKEFESDVASISVTLLKAMGEEAVVAYKTLSVV